MFCYVGEDVYVKCAKSDSSIHTLLAGSSRSQVNLLSRTTILEDNACGTDVDSTGGRTGADLGVVVLEGELK